MSHRRDTPSRSVKLERFNLVGFVPWRKRLQFLRLWASTFLPKRCKCANCRQRGWEVFFYGY